VNEHQIPNISGSSCLEENAPLSASFGQVYVSNALQITISTFLCKFILIDSYSTYSIFPLQYINARIYLSIADIRSQLLVNCNFRVCYLLVSVYIYFFSQKPQIFQELVAIS
jgi:hypothetical protein